MKYKQALYWFTNDLRLRHNQAFEAMLKQTKQVCFVYIHDTSLCTGQLYQTEGYSEHRLQFLHQALVDLSGQLEQFGHRLIVLQGKPENLISQLIEHTQAQAVFMTESFAYYERQTLKSLQQVHKDIEFHCSSQFALVDLAARLQDEKLFKTFTKFRIKLEDEGLEINRVQTSNLQLPESLPTKQGLHFKGDIGADLAQLVKGNIQPAEDCYIEGGEQAALDHLQNYFSSSAPSEYKTTRNELDDWSSSTKLSAYFALGCLSAQQVWHRVEQYERDVVSNESTYWIKFELLWREYFLWQSRRLGRDLYLFAGRGNRAPLTSFYPERFAKWVNGNTPYPIVNACMKQLKQTGYMSNRGRQLVASCLIHELAMDWRYGAAYFEQQLLDYDPAANWGNWQYLAGVGADPRGSRQFNLAKQTQMYDPEHSFINKWQGDTHASELDSIDMVDWPKAEVQCQ